MQKHTQVVQVGNKTITLETGRFSEQIEAAVLATCGGTVVHATVGLGPVSSLPYFPLQVEYVENLYAGGRIKGSRWVKRAGRPSDEAILAGRVIDRSIRPLFPDGLTREVQVIVSVLSVDMENNPDVVGMVAAMAALEISSIPFAGPIAGVRVAYHRETDAFTFNPTHAEQEGSALDLIIAGTQDAVVMVEAGANELDEETMIRAFTDGHAVIQQICAGLAELRKAVGKEKFELPAMPDHSAVLETLRSRFQNEVHAAVVAQAHLQKDSTIDDIITQLRLEDETMIDVPLSDLFHQLMKEEARRMTLDGERADGRKLDEIREITCEVDILPTTHGSAVFKRGATQVLSIVTLGSPALGQLIENMEGETVRNYIHHYSMPPYASGEVGRIGSPKRREIGHGALAERALLPMIPSQEVFPYTIQVVSEVMSSNGSTSQGSVCGSTLSLMAAGVPLIKPVSGIAMGLMKEGDRYAILSDIQGLEDHVGDMDFKVAGTVDGITAIQMDIKVDGLTLQILREALTQAKQGRLFIMDKMMAVISEPRKQLAKNAPKIESTKIAVERIGELIGPGGKNIRGIIERSGAEVNVEDDGSVYVSSSDQDAIDRAMGEIKDMMLELEEGMEFDGEVSRVEDYGAFVDLVAGKTGLVHVSKMSTEYVQSATDLVNVGDRVHVRVVELDGDRIRLSMLTEEQEQEVEAKRKERQGDRPPREGGDRPQRGGFGGDRGGRGGDRGGNRGGFRRDR